MTEVESHEQYNKSDSFGINKVEPRKLFRPYTILKVFVFWEENMNIFIGCGSEIVEDKFYKNSLSLITKIASLDNVSLVFGAYHHGLMGSCYDIFKNHGKKITGITLECYRKQLEDLELDEEVVVETSMDRMREIYQKSDIMVFTPGGLGTYAEILSSIEELRTKEEEKLIILYNDDFFYTPLIKEMYWLYENKFNSKNISEYCRIESKEEEIVRLIEKEKEQLSSGG